MTKEIDDLRAALEAIVVRCDEGDPRTNWLPTISDIAKRALAAPSPDKGEIAESDDRIGSWLAVALEDPQVGEEMKADIEAWFKARK